MGKYNLNKYLGIGTIAYLINYGIGHFIPLPDMLSGFLVGISLAFYTVGIYSLNHDISKIQGFKNRYLNRFDKRV